MRTYPGLGGGLELGREAKDLTMLEALEALDGPVALARCTLNPEMCPRSGYCPMHKLWKDMEAGIIAQLRQVTFLEIAQKEKQAHQAA